MEILLTVVVYVVAIAISTLVFGASLFLVEDLKESSFRTEGAKATWGKCAGIVVAMTLIRLLPFGPWLALIAFFVGVMALFQKDVPTSVAAPDHQWFVLDGGVVGDRQSAYGAVVEQLK
jgi:hypothetical protein